MPFIKVVKNKAYFKRYQTQFRRRREGKTDYFARRRLVTQDKNKYNTPKHRFIVRFTNQRIICQVASSTIDGDVMLAVAYSHELPRYGVKLGLTNYAAAYATGLLCARRLLTKLNLASRYEGQVKVDGEHFIVEPTETGPRPFKALLDVGLARTSTGSRIFAAVKGMCDGGVNVPHSERRFVGYNAGEKKFDPAVLRKYIFGGHVAAYMKQLLEEDPARYDAQFARYKKEGITHDKIEKIYANAHAAIRKDPSFVAKPKKTYPAGSKPKRFNKRALTLAERRVRVQNKKAKLGFPKAN